MLALRSTEREKRRTAKRRLISTNEARTRHIYTYVCAYSGGDGTASVPAFPLCLSGDNRNKRAAEKGGRAADEQGCRMVMRSTHPCVPVIPMTPCADAAVAAPTAATAPRCRGHCLSASKLDGPATAARRCFVHCVKISRKGHQGGSHLNTLTSTDGTLLSAPRVSTVMTKPAAKATGRALHIRTL